MAALAQNVQQGLAWLGAAVRDRELVEATVNFIVYLSPPLFLVLNFVTAPFGRHAVNVRARARARARSQSPETTPNLTGIAPRAACACEIPDHGEPLLWAQDQPPPGVVVRAERGGPT